MSDKFYVGRDLISFTDNGKYKPISRITLKLDDENVVTAGDDTGMELVADCPFATQEMADALLAQYQGYQYQAYEAGAVNIDPAAELGDGLTADGHYSVISRTDDDGSGYPNLSAPGEAEMEEEYPSAGPMTQEFNRKIAEAYSRISKTAEEISLEIIGLQNAHSELELSLSEFKVSIEGLEGDFAELSLTIDGLTVTDSTGTTKIRGSSIETETLYVDAANITGTLTIGQLSSEVATEDQIPIYTSELINNSGYQTESGVVTIVNGVVTADYVYALGVEASTIRGSVISVKNNSGTTTATITPGLTTAAGLDITSQGNLYLGGAYGSVAFDSTGAYFGNNYGTVQVTSAQLYMQGPYGRFQIDSRAAYVVAGSTAGRTFCPLGEQLNLGSATYGLWSAVFASSTTITTSDRNLKNSIEDLDEKYLRLILWLTPKRFKMNNGTSNRYHVGFIAQDVWEGMELFGISDLEFAGWVKDVDAEGNEIYMLRYEEFIGLLALALQNHEERLLKLEATV